MKLKERKEQFRSHLEEWRQREAEWLRNFPREEPIFEDLPDRAAVLRRATPPWADRMAIRCVYAECVLTSARTGVTHHVDHIVPLQGVYVSGLHVVENLRIIPSRDNVVKKNRFEPE